MYNKKVKTSQLKRNMKSKLKIKSSRLKLKFLNITVITCQTSQFLNLKFKALNVWD